MKDKSNQKKPILMQQKGVEIICIGSELLLGNILNSNAKWLSEELASLGLPHYRQTVIGDNYIRLKEAILEASHRSQILITTGGLGPTPDDITNETIASCFNTQLEEREEIWENIKNKLNKKSIPIPSSNKKQALLPPEALIIKNASGTAPGMIWSPINEFTILTFPGVPSEMKQMWQDSAIPWLRKHNETKGIFISKVLRFAGISESKLAEDINDLTQLINPTVAPYASLGEVKLRITANSKDAAEASKLIKPIEKEIKSRTGLKFFGSDEESLASVVLKLLRERGETLSVAESCTGGGICSALTAVPGSSDVFLGGIIAYQNSIKINLLDVSEELISDFGAVSSEVVKAMAEGVRKKFKSNWSIATSGVAGPKGGSITKPVGLVQFSISCANNLESGHEYFSPHIGRLGIQKLSVLKGLDKLRLFLLNKR